MNRAEGMRRLGLLLGITGALAGCVYAANEIKTIHAHYKFESLAKSNLVKDETASYIARLKSSPILKMGRRLKVNGN